MPLGQGIVEVLRSIPPRIEVTGHGPTLRITAGSFDAALDYARERLDDPAVLDCELRNRLWPRVTLTVTTEPRLAASAPPLEAVRQRAEQQEESSRASRGAAHRAEAGVHRAEPAQQVSHEAGLSLLEEIFADQEQARQSRVTRIPAQRRDAD